MTAEHSRRQAVTAVVKRQKAEAIADAKWLAEDAALSRIAYGGGDDIEIF